MEKLLILIFCKFIIIRVVLFLTEQIKLDRSILKTYKTITKNSLNIEIVNQTKLFSMFNQNSFSIDSSHNPNNSFNFNSPAQKRLSNQSDSFRNNEDEYDFGFNLANYNFRDVNAADPVKNHNSELKVQPRISKQHAFKKNQQKVQQQRASNDFLQKISEKPSSLMSEEERPRGLLKQKMKVDYAFDQKKTPQSELVLPSKPSQKFPTFSEISRSDISANLFSCMDAPQYQRDFEISPKVIARKYF